MIHATGKTPDDELCQAAWNNTLRKEQQDLRYSLWMHGCADASTP